MLERQQSFFGERVKKSNQLRQQGGARGLAVKRIGNELPHVSTGEGRQADLLHQRSGFPDRI
jgi:hypothetical protein